MILANEQVAGLLARRGCRRSTASTSARTRAVEPLVERLAASACRPRRCRSARAARSSPPSRGRPRCSRPMLRERAADAARPLVAAPALARPGALRPAKPRPRGPRLDGLLPLHVADPALPGPRLPSRACAAGSGEEAAERERPRRARRAPRRRERAAADVERRPTASAWRACSWSASARRRTSTFEGEITGLIGAGLFVRFADVFEGFLPARRLDFGDRFDVERARHGARGPGNGRRYPAGRRARRRRHGDRRAARAGHARLLAGRARPRPRPRPRRGSGSAAPAARRAAPARRRRGRP